MKTTLTFALILATFTSVTAFAQEEAVCACKAMPEVSLKGTDGRTYNKASLTAKPTVLVFFKAGCPHNPKSVPDFNRLASSFGASAAVIAISDMSAAEATQFAKKNATKFVILGGASAATLESFGAKHSLDLALICGKDKKVARTWEGYSRTTITEIVAELPNHGGKKVAIDLSKFSTKRASGCAF